MKKIILILFLGSSFVSFAQKIPAQIAKKATAVSEYITAEMNLDADQKKDIYIILSEKYVSNRKNIRGKDLSREEKQKIYKASFNETKKNLSEKFSMKEVNMINKLHREWQKNNKK
tara:strand:+ start:3936 stop:4283 length:348 start_codon:yes stop_codon:yes gene_type:complete